LVENPAQLIVSREGGGHGRSPDPCWRCQHSLKQRRLGALCLGQDLSSPDLPIQGCTAVIQTGRKLLDRLATAYNNRGVAYRLKAEYDRAIEDFDEAIKLRPNFANAFNNRAVAYRNNGDLDHALAG
jgi:tetratricopeptide (TPR) repeat protein